MAHLTTDDKRYIQRSRTKSVWRSAHERFDRMYDEKNNKGRKITIAPGIVFIRAK